MKTHSLIFVSEPELTEFCCVHGIADNSSLLIQVFSGIVTLNSIKDLQQLLTERFPKAVIIGSTSDGAIMQGEMIDIEKIVLVFSQFYHTQLRTCFVEHKTDNHFESGVTIAKALVTKQTRAMITFSDGLSTNGEEYLNGINSICPQVVVAGGMAGDNAQLVETFVFTDLEVTNNGAVAVVLDNPNLYVYTNYSFNWLPIGKQMCITKVEKNRVYEIDGLTAYDIYSKYLSNDIAKQLPGTGIEFPLTLNRHDVIIGRAVFERKEDDSLVFAGNIEKGELVRFGIGNADLILQKSRYNAEQFNGRPVETIFIYSCMGRRHFMGDSIRAELSPLGEIAPAVGFFTHGEFFYQEGHTQLMNQTMTLMAVSESNEIRHTHFAPPNKIDKEPQVRTDALLALGHLANTVTMELEILNSDLEERVREKTDYILKQLYTDGLTNLPNRLKLLNDLDGKKDSYIVLVNIDDFTSINDFFGNAMGDYILKAVAEALMQFIDTNRATLYKLPSDEYAVLHHSYLSKDVIISLLKTLSDHLHNLTFNYEDQSLQISVTLATALVEHGTIGLGHADMALKYAKQTKCSYLVYDEGMHLSKNVEENLRMAKIVRSAIAERRIVPYYQPIFDLRSGEIICYECLARLIENDGNIIGPYQFLSVAQKIRVYTQITRLMIEQSLACLKQETVKLNINLSIEDILDLETRKYLIQKLEEREIGEHITFEILETQQLEEDETVNCFIKDIQNLGGKIAIDDFGSGFANFQHMTRIQADIIKIDGSLIRKIDSEKNAHLVVETIITFAKKMGLVTVAEFIHSEDVLTVVKEIGIDYGQGFHLAKPEELLLRL